MAHENVWSNEYNPFNKYKVLAWYDRMKAIKEKRFMAPVNIALDIVQGTGERKKCGGLHCNFCMSDLEDEGSEAYIPKELLLEIPAFYADWGVKSICLAGHHSDPLMYPHKILIQFLKLCKKYEVEVGFVSNGLLYTDAMIEAVAETCNWSGWSINAGRSDTHECITGKQGAFEKIISNMHKMRDYLRCHHYLNHDIGYKFLITDDNHREILDAVKIAKESGTRHMQIRPCELPLHRTARIDVENVDAQLRASLKYEEPGVFEIFGIREKFTPKFTKKTPKRCIASPLGSTWKADGDIVICPDRRWSAHKPHMTLGNFVTEGLQAIREKWGGEQHMKMIEEANKRLGTCIRCTSYHWHDLYENVVNRDNMDITLI